MTTTEMTRPAKAAPMPRNGIDTPKLLATIGAVGGQPELAKFRFRATNKWVKGTHSRTTMFDFFGAGGEHQHRGATVADSDHPEVLCGADNGPSPVEWVLHALASCLMAGIGNIAAVRGVTLHEVEARIEGDIDLRGILGLSDKVRNGYQNLRVEFDIRGDATPEKLTQIVEQSKARSAVYDIVTKGVPVSVAVNAYHPR